MNDIVAIMRAADFADRKHAKQKRKGDEAEPYLNHLIEVGALGPRHSDFDRFDSKKLWQLRWINEQFDAAGGFRLAPDEAASFERIFVRPPGHAADPV